VTLEEKEIRHDQINTMHYVCTTNEPPRACGGGGGGGAPGEAQPVLGVNCGCRESRGHAPVADGCLPDDSTRASLRAARQARDSAGDAEAILDEGRTSTWSPAVRNEARGSAPTGISLLL